MSNRVTAAIARRRESIAERLADGRLTESQLAKLDDDLKMDLGEFARFQTLKSHAMLEGKLTEEEAQTIYALLGETPSVFNAQPIEVKVVLTTVFSELLQGRGHKIN